MKVSDIVSKINHFKLLKYLGTVLKYTRPREKGEHGLSVVVFSDANRQDSNGQIGSIASVGIVEFKKGALFHTLDWSSRKSRRPVRSIGSAETKLHEWLSMKRKFWQRP